MADVLDSIDETLASVRLSEDAMRWTPDTAVDYRTAITRSMPTELQQTWQWWCTSCCQPIPQPRWWRHGVPEGGAVLSNGLRAYHETTDRRAPWHAIVKRAV
jgi:hypothetical protein